MATCKDCIHEKVCVITAFPEAFENTKWEKEPCDHFKDKADFVEVKHSRWENISGFDVCNICGTSPACCEPKPNNPKGYPPYCHHCMRNLMRKAFDLINRKNQKIAELQRQLDAVSKEHEKEKIKNF